MRFPEGAKLNLLAAYPYVSQPLISELKKGGDDIRFLLDSGAFTAWKAGKPIKLDDYCRFIESLPIKPWRYFTLDVIGDAEASMRNYETMLERGFKPVPIFTRGENLEALDYYYQTSDVVGIGGLVGTRGNKGFINGVMKAVGKRRVHWLGFTSLEYLKKYRPYMCDSSTWESGARYATIQLYMGGGQFEIIKKQDFASRLNERVLKRIKRLGFDPFVLRKSESWAGGPSVSRNLCAASGVAFSVDVEKNLGTRLFNALTTPQALGQLIYHFKRLAK